MEQEFENLQEICPEREMPVQELSEQDMLAQEMAELEMFEQETIPQENTYRLSFAEDLYEVPSQIECKPKKVHKPRVKRARTGGCMLGWIALVVVIALVSSLVTALVLDSRWQKRMDSMRLAMQEKNAALQDQISDIHIQASVAYTAAPGELMTPGQVYAQNVDAVVAISSTRQKTVYGQSGVYKSMGSGFILSPDGYVVSNYHVVENAETIEVLTADGGSYEASLVGYDETNDISLLKVDGVNLPYVTLGSSTKLMVGDQVAAIGNPLGELTSSMTVGYVSGKDRIITTDGPTINMIQTDAAINSGNSGGPLFNMKGEVVGITTAKFSGLSQSGVSIEGIGFAIPMDDVIGMIESLRELGYVPEAYLGVMVLDVPAAEQAYGLPAGAYVDEVTAGCAAEEAGILAHDIIIDLGGYPVTSVEELTRTLRKFEPDQTVSVTVYRAGKQVTLQVTLDEKPRDIVAAQPAQRYPMPGDEGFEEWYRQFMEEYFG